IYFFSCSLPSRDLHAFPTRRSSDLLTASVRSFTKSPWHKGQRYIPDERRNERKVRKHIIRPVDEFRPGRLDRLLYVRPGALSCRSASSSASTVVPRFSNRSRSRCPSPRPVKYACATTPSA